MTQSWRGGCLCATCYHCGHVAFKELESLVGSVSETFGTEPGVKDICMDLVSRVRCIKDSYRTFYKHTAEESGIGSHCRRHALSSPVGLEQGCDCTLEKHCNRAGDLPTELQPFEEWTAEHWPELLDLDGVVEDSAWNEQCHVFPFDPSDMSKRPGMADTKHTVPVPGHAGCGRGGLVNMPLMCHYCPNIAHKGCVNAPKLDPELDDYVCGACRQRLDELMHSMSCQECNAQPYVLAAIACLLEHLAQLEDNAASEAVPRWMMPKLAKLRTKLANYRAHKIQDAHTTQAYAKELQQLEVNEVMLVADYAAKRFGLQTSMTQADGYGQGAGRISQHITSGLMRSRPSDVEPGVVA